MQRCSKNMKRIIFVTLLIFQGLAILAQSGNAKPGSGLEKNKPSRVKVKLYGTVSDARTGEPLPGASVYFADEKIGTVADRNGHYSIMNIPDGHHVIEISHSGYGTIVEHIELLTDTERNFGLLPVITENQAVIVTGVTGATSIRKAPIPVTIMRRSALLQSSSNNIIEALTKIPGVSQLSTGPAISKPVIRGLGYNRVVTINEGARQEGQQWGDEHGIEIDELSIARAEIVKGPASLMYGSDAMAGVINLVTNVPVAEGVFKANLLTNYQTNNELFGIHANAAGNKNGLNWNIYGSHKKAGDYRNAYDGRVLNSRFNEKNFGGYIGINKSWGFSHLIVSRFNQQTGLVEGDRDDASGQFLLFAGTPLERIASTSDLDSKDPFTPYQRIQHNKIVSDNNLAIGKNRLKINLAYQQNLRKEFGDPFNPGEEELFFDLKTINYNLQWQLPEMKEWHTTIGVNGMRQSNRNKGEEVLIPEYNLFDIGTFIYTQRFFKKATLSGGIRYDNRSINSKFYREGPEIKFEAFERNFSNISGSIGLSYEPTSMITLKANLARGFRSPSLAELASNGAHEGTNRYEYGDKNLSSEISWQGDAGIEVDYEHFHINLTAFYNRISNFIFYRKLVSAFGGDSLVTVDGEDIPAFQFDQHTASLYGLEATIDIHPHPLDWLHFENSFSFVRGRFNSAIDGSANLPLVPAARWNSELRANLLKAGKCFQNFYVKLEADRTFNQHNSFTGYETETNTPGYTLFHAGLGADVQQKKKTLFSLHFAVTNITDKAYQQHLSRLKYAAMNMLTGRQGVFNTGRNFSVKLNIPLELKW